MGEREGGEGRFNYSLENEIRVFVESTEWMKEGGREKWEESKCEMRSEEREEREDEDEDEDERESACS